VPSSGSPRASTCDGRSRALVRIRGNGSLGSRHGDPEGLRHRDRVRDHGARGRQQPGHGIVAAHQRLPRRAHPTAQCRASGGTSRTSTRQRRAGFSLDDALAPEIETHLVNAVLTNGARYYVDHAHPEISTPECRDAREAVVFDRAAEQIVRLMRGRRQMLPDGAEIVATRTTPTARATATAATRTTCWTRDTVRTDRRPRHGALRHPPGLHRCRQGRLRAAQGRTGRRRAVPDHPARRLLRRGGRPRDHAEAADRQHPRRTARDASKYRRLHVIVGDANMSEVATFLKVGTTTIVLAMVEDDVPPDDLRARQSRCRRCARSATTSPAAAARLLRRHHRHGDRDPVGACSSGPASTPRARTASRRRRRGRCRACLRRWEAVLTGSSATRMRWPTSSTGWPSDRLIEGYRERHGLARATPDSRPRPAVPRHASGQVAVPAGRRERLVRRRGRRRDHRAARRPPGPTSVGGACRRWPTDIVAANWDSLVFDVGTRPAATGADDGTAARHRRPRG
jgi:hypothetical protein